LKIRKGLVSNSSSSSFIIAMPERLENKEMTKRLGVSLDSPLVDFFTEIVSVLTEASSYTEEEYLDDYGYSNWEEFEEDYGLSERSEIAKEAFKKGWIVLQGYASDECGGVEAAICDAEIKYRSDDLIIYKEGGY
jgi:hypothetical protein